MDQRRQWPTTLPPSDAQMAADWWDALGPSEKQRAVAEAQTFNVQACWDHWVKVGYSPETVPVPRWRGQ